VIDPSAAAFTEQAIQTTGVPIQIVRLTGYAPNVTSVSASITAVVRMVLSDSSVESRTGVGAGAPGAITQDDRLVILTTADLTAAGFPTPVQKGDRVVLTATAEEFDVVKIDPYKRALAGAIELTIAGVS
jgi:hypothetical protein